MRGCRSRGAFSTFLTIWLLGRDAFSLVILIETACIHFPRKIVDRLGSRGLKIRISHSSVELTPYHSLSRALVDRPSSTMLFASPLTCYVRFQGSNAMLTHHLRLVKTERRVVALPAERSRRGMPRANQTWSQHLSVHQVASHAIRFPSGCLAADLMLYELYSSHRFAIRDKIKTSTTTEVHERKVTTM
jgi:hypothetical protein